MIPDANDLQRSSRYCNSCNTADCMRVYTLSELKEVYGWLRGSQWLDMNAIEIPLLCEGRS